MITDWIQVEAGGAHNCGIGRLDASTRQLRCWGDNSEGQLGTGGPDDDPHSSPLSIITSSALTLSLATGADHSCGIYSGLAYCWGANGGLQLGDAVDRNGPDEAVGVLDSTDWTAVTAGDAHSCGLRGSALYCWGAYGDGRLGSELTADTAEPVSVGAELSWTSVDAGSAHTCGLANGHIYCWGDGANGQLGDGNNTTSPTPVLVDTTNVTP